MDTTNYARLRKVAELRYLDSDKEVLESGQKSLAESRSSLEEISANLPNVMTGEALSSAQATLATLTEELATKERLIAAFLGHHERARASMRRAAAAFNELPTILVDHGTEQMVRAEERLFINGSYVTPQAYLQALRIQANAEREAQAAAALAAMEAEVSSYRGALSTETGEIVDPGNIDVDGGGEAPKGTGATAGAAVGAIGAALARNRFNAGRKQTGSTVTAGSTGTTGGAGIINRPGVYRRPPASGPGSRTEPINDPNALRHLDLYNTPVNPRMSADGPIGGYLPAAVTDGTDPRWSSEAARAAAHASRPTLSAGMLLSGGAGLTAGALGRGTAAHETRAMGAGGILGGAGVAGTRAVMGAGSSSAALAGGLHNSGAAGTANVMGAAGRMPMAGNLAASGLPSSALTGTSSAAGAGTAAMNATAASSTATNSMNGLARAGAPGGMNPGVGAPAGTPGTPGIPGAYAPGTAAASSERKSGKDRIGYQVIRIRDDERRPIRLSEGAGAGNSADMKPINFNDTDDSWE